MPGYRSPNTPVDRTLQGSPYYNPQGPGANFQGGSTPMTGRGGGGDSGDWLRYLQGELENQTTRDLGFGKLDLDKLLGQGQLDLGGRELDFTNQLGNRGLDIRGQELGVSQRLGEGNINKDLALGFGGIGKDFALGQGEQATNQYLGQLQAGSSNLGSILDLFGVMENAGASRYGADQGLQGIRDRGLADQFIQQMRGESDMGVANIQNQPAIFAEQNKASRFGSVANFMLPVIGQVLGQQFGIPIPDFQQFSSPQSPPTTLAQAPQVPQQVPQNNQAANPGLALRENDMARRAQQAPPAAAPQAPPRQNPLMGLINQMGAMPQAPQAPQMPQFNMPQVMPPRPAPQQEAPAFQMPQPGPGGAISIPRNAAMPRRPMPQLL